MASSPESTSMALFCDFENVALGVRDAHHDKFDIKRVLERLLLKGSIVVKKAYCDWDRYKHFKGTMHEANFELIEIPHVRQSGKNSADIRLVVDALDLCYTKSHVDTFVIISGDSDFSPLVSKLRENAKQVIGVGVKQSTSDLLIANCDEFIFYDDLVREGQRAAARRAQQQEAPASRRQQDGSSDGRRNGPAKEDPDARRVKAIDLAVETLEALGSERGDGGKIRTSVLKDAIKRRKPDFNENYFGFRSFGALLEEAQARGMLEIVRDEKANAYVQRAVNGGARHEARMQEAPVSHSHGVPQPQQQRDTARPVAQPQPQPQPQAVEEAVPAPFASPAPMPVRIVGELEESVDSMPYLEAEAAAAAASRGKPRAGRKTNRRSSGSSAAQKPEVAAAPEPERVPEVAPEPEPAPARRAAPAPKPAPAPVAEDIEEEVESEPEVQAEADSASAAAPPARARKTASRPRSRAAAAPKSAPRRPRKKATPDVE